MEGSRLGEGKRPSRGLPFASDNHNALRRPARLVSRRQKISRKASLPAKSPKHRQVSVHRIAALSTSEICEKCCCCHKGRVGRFSVGAWSLVLLLQCSTARPVGDATYPTFIIVIADNRRLPNHSSSLRQTKDFYNYNPFDLLSSSTNTTTLLNTQLTLDSPQIHAYPPRAVSSVGLGFHRFISTPSLLSWDVYANQHAGRK